jgi:hypothetical protein
VAVASAVGAQVSEADEAAVRDKVEGLPSSHVCDNGEVAEGGWDEKLDVPAISRKDAQVRFLLLRPMTSETEESQAAIRAR